jgi:hypothetical protein
MSTDRSLLHWFITQSQTQGLPWKETAARRAAAAHGVCLCVCVCVCCVFGGGRSLAALPAGHLGYTYTTLICGAMEGPLHD